MTLCNKCSDILVIGTNWTESSAKSKTYTCNTCKAEYQRAYHKANKEKQNSRNMARYYENKIEVLEKQKYTKIANKYGLTRDEYLELMSDASCEICGIKEDLCVDHSHKTGEVRGVLCRKCNAGLGLLGDEYENIIKALEYLNVSGT